MVGGNDYCSCDEQLYNCIEEITHCTAKRVSPESLQLWSAESIRAKYPIVESISISICKNVAVKDLNPVNSRLRQQEGRFRMLPGLSVSCSCR